MLFARGHLNLYLSSRISFPRSFVHLSFPFSSRVSSASVPPLCFAVCEFDVYTAEEKSKGIIGKTGVGDGVGGSNRKLNDHRGGCLFVISILFIESPRKTFGVVGYL